MFEVRRIDRGLSVGVSKHRTMRVARRRLRAQLQRTDLPTTTWGFRILNLKTGNWVGPLMAVH